MLVLVRLGIADHPPRASGPAVRRSRAVNRLLLGSPVLRPVYLALWVPNGLVVGCEALIVPFAGERAGFLFAATAVGMLTGDVLMGRVVPPHYRDRLVEPARLLLAVPWLFFLLEPSLPVRVPRSPPSRRSATARACRSRSGWSPGPRATSAARCSGLHSLGMMSMQGAGALAAGGVATLLGADAQAAGLAMGVMAVASVAVTLALTPGLRRSRAGRPVEVLALPRASASRCPHPGRHGDRPPGSCAPAGQRRPPSTGGSGPSATPACHRTVASTPRAVRAWRTSPRASVANRGSSRSS